MKTISMQTNMVTNLGSSAALAPVVGGNVGLWGRKHAPAWLPAPPASRKVVVKPAPRLTSIWISTETDLMDNLMMLFLVAASIIGIGYGLSLMMDLVANWAVSNSISAILGV